MIREVIQPPNPKLRKKSKTVVKIDNKIKLLIKDLKDTLANQTDPEGVGLAAPQISKNVRVFLMNFSKEDAKKHGEKNLSKIVINPVIQSISKVKKADKKKKERILEGCLSLPRYYGPLTRSNKVVLKYMNEAGKTVEQTFTEFPAQIILHEIDHLNGILFVDRILEQNQTLYEYSNDEWIEVDI